MSFTKTCNDCRNVIARSASKCPHCGRPSLFPNVDKALSEQSDLESRYEKATDDARLRGVITNVEDFEKATKNSFAVINRGLSELERLVGSDFEIYATFYQLSGTTKMPTGEVWDSRRESADSIIFTGYKEEIRFAALSLDSVGLSNYGDCSWVLREEMIAHRASVFETNTTIFVKQQNIHDEEEMPKGYRAVWDDRAKLCVTKIAKKINATTKSADYSYLLLNQGASSSDDEFAEVHIFGPMTIRTIGEVSFKPLSSGLDKRKKKVKNAQIAGIKEKLAKYGVTVN